MRIPDTVDPALSSGIHDRPDAASRSKSIRAASWAAAAGLLTLVASVTGLLVEGIYTGDRATAEMLRGYDAVSATVVVPLLAVAAWRSRTASIRACLTASSVLAYLAYTYAVYLFGTGFNDLFLLHAAVLAAALVGLVRYLATIDVAAASDLLNDRAHGRPAAAVLGLLAVALGGMWVYFGVYNAVTGEVPTGSQLVETETMVKLGMALDLTVLVPLYSSAAVLLWRRQPWGYVLGVIALVAGLLHQLGYVVAMPFQAVADIPGAAFSDLGEPVIVLLYALGCWLLFGARGRDAATRRGRQVTTEDNHRPITARGGVDEVVMMVDGRTRGWVDLYWLPLGADGTGLVRVCGRGYERLAARKAGRTPLDLYHSALKVCRDDATHVIEVAPVWSRPERERGVLAGGAVGSRWLGASRWFRYEVRCWPNGVLPDEDKAVESPVRVSVDPADAAAVLDMVRRVPTPVWGRDELGAGEMWNSNSVIAWLLAGIGERAARPPSGGRAPGWAAGLRVAVGQHVTSTVHSQ